MIPHIGLRVASELPQLVRFTDRTMEDASVGVERRQSHAGTFCIA
jgi:hypothetical protein